MENYAMDEIRKLQQNIITEEKPSFQRKHLRKSTQPGKAELG